MPIPKPIPTIPFTQEAFDKLENDLKKLQKERVEIMERLKTAREMGDLSENGAYKYAKFELGNVSRQLRQVKHLIENGYIKTVTKHSGVDFGSKVSLLQGKQEMMFIMVSEHESDLTQNKLAMTSPLGQALMGKVIGDTITVEAPSGQMQYIIKDIA